MSGRADVLDRNDGVADQLAARRWSEPVPGVVVLHCGPLIRAAREWLAVLAGGSAAALCSWSALSLHGLQGWFRDSTHLVVPRWTPAPGRAASARPAVCLPPSYSRA
ncbi:MAG: hypothetical protein ACJ71T_05460 [Actinomycetales bacterium]